MAVMSGIKWDAFFGPECARFADCGVAEYCGRLGEGFCLNQQFIAVRRTTSDAQRLVAANLQLPSFLAAEIEDKDAMLHIFRVREEDGISDDAPIADGSIVFRDDIDPLVFPIRPKADFDDPAIRRVAICDGENLVIHQPQSEGVVDLCE